MPQHCLVLAWYSCRVISIHVGCQEFSSPAVHDVSDDKNIMQRAKEVLRNGRKALACTKDANSKYDKDGNVLQGEQLRITTITFANVCT
jgi:hypothetical protein